MSRYKKGDRFVIEISSVFEGGQDSPYNFYRIKGLDNFNFFARDLDKIQRVTDFDRKMYTGDELEDERAASYDEGFEDAWKMVKKIALNPNQGAFTGQELKEIFGFDTSYSIFSNLSATEVLERISNYEAEKDKIHVGDVVRSKVNPKVFILVTEVSDDMFDGIKLSESDVYGKLYSCYFNRKISGYEKTGQHYNLDEIFKPMRVEGDE